MEYKKASLTSDIIVYYDDKVLLIERKNDPFKNLLAIPGGYLELEKDETFIEAAIRELKEETNITAKEDQLVYLKTLDDPKRDPRGRTISEVFRLNINDDQYNEIKAGDDAKDYKWINIFDIKNIELAFDHKQVILDAFQEYLECLN
jgi:ADP-ribose pyrophosphatase YjhB (NUDIX family)